MSDAFEKVSLSMSDFARAPGEDAEAWVECSPRCFAALERAGLPTERLHAAPRREYAHRWSCLLFIDRAPHGMFEGYKLPMTADKLQEQHEWTSFLYEKRAVLLSAYRLGGEQAMTTCFDMLWREKWECSPAAAMCGTRPRSFASGIPVAGERSKQARKVRRG